MINYDSHEYKRSRMAYIWECAFEYFVALMTMDAFLAKLLQNIGISDSLIGIISTFVSFAYLFDLMSIYLMEKNVQAKKTVILFKIASCMFFSIPYAVPFMPIGKAAKIFIAAISVMLAYSTRFTISSVCFIWANSYVEPRKRARYSGNKEIVSLVSGMIVSLAASRVIEKCESAGNIGRGFLIIAVSMLIFGICDVLTLLLIKKDEPQKTKKTMQPVFKVIKEIMSNKNYVNVIIMTILWEAGRYLTLGFLGIYKTKELMISVFTVQVINIIASVMRILITCVLGKYSDKHSYAKGMNLAMIIAAAGFLVNVFTVKSTWMLIAVHTVLYNCALAGTQQNSLNIVYSYVKQEHVTQALALKCAIGGLCGFAASLIGGKILSAVQANGNMIFGVHIYGQQLLSAISCVILGAAIVFVRRVIEKQEITVQ